MGTPHTIFLKGVGLQKEAKAQAAITPGDLIQFHGAAGVYTSLMVKVHATVGGKARHAFALENDLIGRGIDDAYAAGETVKYVVAQPGEEILARLGAAATCVAGDFLESAGNGRLVPQSGTDPDTATIGIALESQASAGGRVRIESL